jgi:hypothetical protein
MGTFEQQVLISPAVKLRTPFVQYTFSIEEKAYAFCTGDLADACGFKREADGEYLDVCGVWVVEEPGRIVLAIRLAYYLDADTLSWEDCHVETFKPGSWLPTMLGIAERAHQQERARKNFV